MEGLDFRIGLDTEEGISGASKLDKQIEALEKHVRQLEGPEKIDALQKKIGKLSAGPFQKMISAGLDPFLHKMKEIGEFEFIREGTAKLLELPGELAHEVFALGEEMLRTAAKAERTESSFKLLFGAQGGIDALEDIEKIGAHTEFTRNRIKGLTQELGKVGFEGQGLKRARAAALDIAAFSSNPEEGLASAEGALERIKRTGRVDNRTLGGLGIGEKDFLGELAKRTGHSAKALKKELDEGKVNSERSLEALYTVITKKTGKKLGGAGADISTGLDATLTHLGELPERYFEKLSHSGGFEKFGEQLKHLLDDLDPESPTGARVFTALGGAFATVGNAIGEIDVADLATKFSSAFEEIASDVKPAVHVLHEVWDVVHNIGIGLGVMGGAVNDYLIKPFDKVNKRLNNTAVDKSLRGWVHDYTPFGFLEDKLGGKDGVPNPGPAGMSYGAGRSVSDGMSQGMMSGGDDVYQAGMSMGEVAEKGARTKLKSHSPSKLFEDIGFDAAAGFADGMEKSSGMVDRSINLALMAPARVRSASVGGSGFVGNGISITNTIHITGVSGAPGEIGEKIASKLDEILPSQLQSAVQQICIAMGGDITGGS